MRKVPCSRSADAACSHRRVHRAGIVQERVDDVRGAFYLGYPLHPPNEPEKLRADHLARVAVPQLFVQGDRDPLCDLTRLRPAIERIERAELFVVPGDHSFATSRKNPLLGQERWLDRVAALQSEDLTVLPGHGPPFTNLAERAAVLKGHHLDRERKILDVLRSGGPQTVYEISRTLWAKLPGYHLALATNEVNSHLEESLADGAVREENGRFALVE